MRQAHERVVDDGELIGVISCRSENDDREHRVSPFQSFAQVHEEGRTATQRKAPRDCGERDLKLRRGCSTICLRRNHSNNPMARSCRMNSRSNVSNESAAASISRDGGSRRDMTTSAHLRMASAMAFESRMG